MGVFDTAARTAARAIPRGVFDYLESKGGGGGATLLDMARQSGPRLTRPAIARGNARLPFGEQTAPAMRQLLARERGSSFLESDIDPRLILGGGAAATIPVGAAAAAGLHAYEPWEEQFGRENSYYDGALTRNDAMRAAARGVRPEDVEETDPELAEALRALDLEGSDRLEVPSRVSDMSKGEGAVKQRLKQLIAAGGRENLMSAEEMADQSAARSRFDREGGFDETPSRWDPFTGQTGLPTAEEIRRQREQERQDQERAQRGQRGRWSADGEQVRYRRSF